MKSLQELAAIRDRMRQTVKTREPGENPIRVQVGMATCGIAMGARPVLNAFTEEVARRGTSGGRACGHRIHHRPGRHGRIRRQSQCTEVMS